MKPFIPLLMTAFLAACTPNEAVPGISAVKGALVLRFDPPLTRATDTSAETLMTALQVLVYRPDGSLEADATFEVEDDAEYALELDEGTKNVVVLANRSTAALPTLSDAEAFLQTYEAVGGALSDGMPMYAFKEGVTVEPARKNPLSVTLVRNVCRVRIQSVDLSGMDAALQGQVSIRGVFLTDVRQQAGLGSQGAPTETSYLHPCGRYEKPAGSGKAAKMRLSTKSGWSIGDGVDCQSGDTFPVNLYCLPNNRETDSFVIPSVLKGGTWDVTGLTPRRTHIVLEAGFGSQTWYYPAALPVLKENTTYSVKFVLTGPGSSDPSVKPSNKDYSAVLAVLPWEEGGGWTEDF